MPGAPVRLPRQGREQRWCLGLCWTPGNPAGTFWDASEPLPGSGALNPCFLHNFFSARGGGNSCTEMETRPFCQLLILRPMETEGSPPLCCHSALHFQVYFNAQIRVVLGVSWGPSLLDLEHLSAPTGTCSANAPAPGLFLTTGLSFFVLAKLSSALINFAQ